LAVILVALIEHLDTKESYELTSSKIFPLGDSGFSGAMGAMFSFSLLAGGGVFSSLGASDLVRGNSFLAFLAVP